MRPERKRKEGAAKLFSVEGRVPEGAGVGKSALSALPAESNRERKGKGTNLRKIDFSDIPELSENQLSRLRRVGRPSLGDDPRKLIAIRLDPKVLNWLRRTAAKKGIPYQSLANEILAEEMRKAG
ncbi:MAG: BrnA antitoxin family protein [Deltaproteobacteria bacterium]|nr:BrnA antitoxin family protein [Deltaproteobacteria bacterium]